MTKYPAEVTVTNRKARSFTTSTIRALLGPLHVFQDFVAILAQSLTLHTILKQRGGKSNALVLLSCFNSVFEIVYSRHEEYSISKYLFLC